MLQREDNLIYFMIPIILTIECFSLALTLISIGGFI